MRTLPRGLEINSRALFLIQMVPSKRLTSICFWCNLCQLDPVYGNECHWDARTALWIICYYPGGECILPEKTEKIMEDRWLSVDEIAVYLGVKRDTIYKWISEKEMPAHRIGRLWKFQRDEVDNWVRDGKANDQGRKA